jgi:hypothetical protein
MPAKKRLRERIDKATERVKMAQRELEAEFMQ